MNHESSSSPSRPPSLFRNWTSLAGLVVAIGALFSFFLLFMLDTVAASSNPYIGLLTYCVVPAFLIGGIFVTLLGAWLEHRKRRRAGAAVPRLQIDLGRARDRRILATFVVGSLLFIMLSAVGTYNAYHVTESVAFCGEVCHQVMKPELTTHDLGPHARVACVQCHVGPGASWFVKSKISGLYQVYATLADKYPRPIPTPIKNLRPARETCEQCHWPPAFNGNIDRTFTYFEEDRSNTPFSVRLLLKVGNGTMTNIPGGGIHWHILAGNTVQYIATDKERQHIPWVRMIDPEGVVTIFKVPGFTNDISHYQIRTMDCIDCHNRPSHRFLSPDTAVNQAMALARIDPTIPWIKTNAVYALTRKYANDEQARDGIATLLTARYPDDPRIRQVIPVVQKIYEDNFFPEMKTDWRSHTDNIGHMIWPGCFRCHDGNHTTADGRRTIQGNDCNSCHTILAQGRGAELNELTPGGQEFKHPGGDYEGLTCSDCHTGGP
ncbi:MAG TPA: NapC/NirT family cytochrome c [Verrucomicrobiae bacterium]|nr:NapC/NirT family cytochrome c [Verrucomicrobiae bacterium]